MDWSMVEATPKYNPFMFELARNVRGWTMHACAKKCGLPTSALYQIERGDRVPTDEEFAALQETLEFPPNFFHQWYETKIELHGCMGKNVPIDYYQYKVFRDVNPPRMAIVK
jgi:transcriptional regulator with XRE-family HTH domain